MSDGDFNNDRNFNNDTDFNVIIIVVVVNITFSLMTFSVSPKPPVDCCGIIIILLM